ncbi:J domain-containing protein [Roseofilum casamattae]|uniref:J domain-containing protein n=1 Tax=Roseofilum casamattae BLCC-M143 TaxID=3022442 RepID=A0ABT7C0D8_9CYAN|nr:J domain-containing protein [Roseofilum casamattae]MDJ1184914.1 J domain-containing protein [Roseofilum casamattae BLCC-M143]
MRYLHRYYQILEVSSNASFDEIHQSYKDLVMVWHPDRFLHNPRLYEKAQEKIKQLNSAYDELRLRWTPVTTSVHYSAASEAWQDTYSNEPNGKPSADSQSRNWSYYRPNSTEYYHTSTEDYTPEYNRTLDEYIRFHSRDMQNWLD